MVCVAVVRQCVGVEEMTGGVARGRELEKNNEARGMGEGDREWSEHARGR